MGAWGLGSDENDWTYDAVGLDISDRLFGIQLTEEGRSKFVQHVLEFNSSNGNGDNINNAKDSVLNLPGVVVFLLKLGCTVPLKHICTAREALANENYHESYPSKAAERQIVVQGEIAMMDAAMDNGGIVSGPPVGVRGIANSAMEK